MEYENIGLYEHFALFSKFFALLFSKILSKFRKMPSNQAIDMHFSNVTVKCHSNDKPWINNKIKALIHSRQQGFSSGNITVYKKLRNQVKREIEKSKVNYYADRVRNLQTIEPRKWH